MAFVLIIRTLHRNAACLLVELFHYRSLCVLRSRDPVKIIVVLGPALEDCLVLCVQYMAFSIINSTTRVVELIQDTFLTLARKPAQREEVVFEHNLRLVYVVWNARRVFRVGMHSLMWDLFAGLHRLTDEVAFADFLIQIGPNMVVVPNMIVQAQ